MCEQSIKFNGVGFSMTGWLAHPPGCAPDVFQHSGPSLAILQEKDPRIHAAIDSRTHRCIRITSPRRRRYSVYPSGLVVSNTPLNLRICLRDVRVRFFDVRFLIVPKLHHNAAVPKCGSSNWLIVKDLVGASGFEPEASCAQGRRATRLRYAPT